MALAVAAGRAFVLPKVRRGARRQGRAPAWEPRAARGPALRLPPALPGWVPAAPCLVRPSWRRGSRESQRSAPPAPPPTPPSPTTPTPPPPPPPCPPSQFMCWCEKIWYSVVRCRTAEAQDMPFPVAWWVALCVGVGVGGPGSGAYARRALASHRHGGGTPSPWVELTTSRAWWAGSAGTLAAVPPPVLKSPTGAACCGSAGEGWCSAVRLALRPAGWPRSGVHARAARYRAVDRLRAGAEAPAMLLRAPTALPRPLPRALRLQPPGLPVPARQL